MTIGFGTMLLMALVPAVAMGASLGSVEEHDAMRQADSQYYSALKRCKKLDGDSKAACTADAVAAHKQTRAAAEAAYGESGAKHRSWDAEAKADFRAARSRCDSVDASRKKACIDDAQMALNEQRVLSGNQAGADRMDANYQVELRGCEALAGREKESCTANARAKYGK